MRLPNWQNKTRSSLITLIPSGNQTWQWKLLPSTDYFPRKKLQFFFGNFPAHRCLMTPGELMTRSAPGIAEEHAAAGTNMVGFNHATWMLHSISVIFGGSIHRCNPFL